MIDGIHTAICCWHGRIRRRFAVLRKWDRFLFYGKYYGELVYIRICQLLIFKISMADKVDARRITLAR